MKYLLDTCTVSYLLNGKFPKVFENFNKHKEMDIAISAITHAELMYGIKKNRVSAKVKRTVIDFCDLITTLPFTKACALAYSEMRSAYENKGISLGAMDGLIAAHAIAERRILITKDQAFSRIKELTVEDWS